MNQWWDYMEKMPAFLVGEKVRDFLYGEPVREEGKSAFPETLGGSKGRSLFFCGRKRKRPCPNPRLSFLINLLPLSYDKTGQDNPNREIGRLSLNLMIVQEEVKSEALKSCNECIGTDDVAVHPHSLQNPG